MKSYKAKIFGLILLWLLGPSLALAQVCDVDNDADIDYNDIGQIFAARNQPASGPDDPRDFDGDGTITVNDGRACVLQCTLPRCAIVDPVNNPPVIISTPVTTATEGALYSYDVDATDPDAGDVLTYSLDLAPAGMTIDATTGLIQWTPAAAQLGDNSVQVRATDAGGLADTQSFTVTVDSAPPVDVPAIDVSPDPLNFGDVFVGSSASLPLVVSNTGTATLSVSSIASSGAPFAVFPPTAFDIGDGGVPRNVDIDFSPVAAGDFNGTITFNSNAANEDPVVVAVTGIGVEPTPDLEPDIDTSDSVDFGAVAEGDSVEQLLTIRNLGDAPLDVSDVSSNDAAFVVSALPGQSIPFVLDPGATQNVSIVFTAPFASAGTELNAILSIISNDPDESPEDVALTADVTAVAAALVNNPILGANVDDTIDNANCGNVTGVVQFAETGSVDTFNVTLTDQGGLAASSGFFSSVAEGGSVSFSGVNACGLDDGILELTVNLGSLDPFVGTPAIKNTSLFPAPILDPVEPVSVLTTVEVCGTSRESTTVSIEGGASTVATQLDTLTTSFCIDVPLRPNTQNTLIATAVDDLAVAPKPSASAPPVQVVHVDPSSIIIAEASSRPLTIEETELLVQNGIIDLDDPTNFNVSMFTIVLTIGQFPVTVSQPVAVPVSSGTGYGSSGGGGWSGGGGGGVPSPIPRPVTGCTVGCSNIVVIKTPTGQTIPGVIIIDGRIKTLKEFFQVTIAIQNTSAGFVLADMEANILLPAGLSPVRAGPGTNVADINTSGEIDSVVIGDIGPMSTGTGQFIIRGDGIGTHNVDVAFDGFLTEGGLPDPIPVSGSAGTSVQVFGPPTFDVVVRHPSDPAGDDVVAGEIYELIVEITNTSPRPALYTSLELFVGGQAELVDENGVPIPDSNEIISFGHIPSGRAVSAAFRVRSSLQGEIIACQAISSENISLTVDTGPDGTACNIANTYPANFEPLPADQPPVVIGINPLNGQPNIPVTSSVFATLTPESSCIVGDTFTNVVEALIDPGDPTKGLQVLSADLVDAGTFYLEELDTFGNPVKHIPTDLTVESPPAGGTTIAVLRLGLDVPHNNSQYFLKDNTSYRATLVGGVGGICSAASGAEMVSDFTWTFSTEQTCSVAPPIASMSTPPDGSVDQPLNQSIVLNFTNRMNPASFSFIPGNLLASSFSVYADAVEAAGEISGGTAVPGSGVFSNLNRTLTYSPLANFAEDIPVHIRLTDGLRDICGNPLQTPPSGVQLLSFQTIPPDTTAPAAPSVNPVPAITNLPAVQVSGQAEAGSTVTITGGSVVQTTTAPASGLFSVGVPLNLNASSNFSVQAIDASSNASAVTTTDNNGDPLTTVHDDVLPTVVSVFPVDGETDVARNIVIQADFDENIDPSTINDLNFTLEGSVIPGTLAAVGNIGFSFTPDNLLDFNTTYNIRVRANGMRDLAGNGLSSEFVASFTTQSFPLPAAATVAPDNGVQGSNFAVVFTGTDLVTAFAVTSGNPGVVGSIVSTSDTSVVANITIDALAIPGLTTLGLTTLGGSASVPFTVTSAPVADAGPDQTILLGDTVTLDGSGSFDADGDPLTFSWSLTSVPAGSTAALSDPSAVTPTFVADVAGSYVAELIVNDGNIDSAPDTVTITTANASPVADAGPDQTVLVGDTVTLDGSGSSDVDGDPLTFSWSLTSVPAGSAAALSDPAAIMPTFVADVAGSYVVQLIVNDGFIDSAPDSVVITTANTPPVSDAGPDQTVLAGDTVTLDGSGSSDVDGDPLTFSWSLTSVPAGSAAALSDPTAVQPTFVADLVGSYVVQLIVNDGLIDSAPDTVVIVANAGTMSLDLVNAVFVGAGRSATLRIQLATPALSDVLVSVTSDNSSILEVAPPGTALIPTGASSADVTVNGIIQGVTTLRANASGFNEATLSVGVTLDLISLPTNVNVPFNQSFAIPVQISPNPAGPGGVEVTLVSSDPSIVQVQTPTVTIAEGSLVANATLFGAGLGTATITASNPGFASDSTAVNSTAELDILQATASFVSNITQDITIQLESGGNPVAAPAGGVSVTLTSDDTDCVAVTSPVSIAAGQVTTTATLGSGGIATLPCTATVTASSLPGIVTDTINVTVNPTPPITLFSLPTNVGAGLQFGFFQGRLGFAQHGGVTVRVESSDPSTLLIAPNATTAGTAFIDIVVPNGQVNFFYFMQGVEGTTGSATITASAPGFVGDSGTGNVVQPAFRLEQLVATIDTLDPDDPFFVRVGLPNAGNTNLAQIQNVRTGSGALTATLTNSNAAFGELVTTASTGQSVTIAIPESTSISPTSVANGGVAFSPQAAGQTTVAATIPGFTATVAASQVVTVTAPTMTLFSLPTNVGAGLQNGFFQGQLSASQHGGVTVRVESSDPATLLISPNATTAGTTFIDIVVPNGQINFFYFMQGVEGTTGSATITASAPGFGSASGTGNVVQPAFRLEGLVGSIDTLDPDDPFFVRVGLPNAGNTNLAQIQNVRTGSGALTATLTNSNAAFGELVTTASTGQSVTVAIPESTSISPTSVANGGVAFSPQAAGQTTVAATIPGFTATVAASQVVTVTAPTMTLFSLPTSVGAGLQNGFFQGRLSASQHGGVTVRIESSDPTTLLISPNATTAGTAFIDIPLANGAVNFFYYIQGLEGTTGSATITASAPGFGSASGTGNVVQPAFRVDGLLATIDTLDPDDAFFVRVGLPNAGNTNLAAIQNVRAGGSALTATLTNSNATAGELVTTALTGQSVTVTIPVNNSISPTSVAAGGVAFNPLTTGDTTVAASIPGFTATNAASQLVTVTAPDITLFSLPTNVGAGLQNGFFQGNLSASQHGGVTVRVESSDPATLLISPNATTAGTAFIDIPLANGSVSFFYYIQGVEGAAATAIVTATASGFLGDTGPVTVVQPAFRLEGLLASIDTLDPDDPFFVRVGLPNASNTNLATIQNVRAGGSPMTATLTNGNATAGELVTTALTGQSVTVTIPVNASSSPFTVAASGVAFSSLATGQTTVAATIPGIIATDAASQVVTVTAPTMTLFSLPTSVGAGLQNGFFQGQLSASQHGGVTVRIESSDPTTLLISPNATTAGTAFIDIPLANGAVNFFYYIQGLEGTTGSATITASAPGFGSASGTGNIVQPALRFEGLAISPTAGATEDPFFVRVGTPNVGNTNLQTIQNVRAGSGGFTATVTNSAAAVGQLVTTASTGQSVTVTIPENASLSPTSVAGGGVAFDPLGAGSTIVEATIPGFITSGAGTVTVNVAP